VKLSGTDGATLYITGVQLEAGSVATPFERRQYGAELALCQRYYIGVDGNADFLALAGASSGGRVNVPVPVTMRASPTCGATQVALRSIYAGSTTIINISNVNVRNNYIEISFGTSAASGVYGGGSPDVRVVSFSAEL
jgi:hypothetical protein